MTDEFKQLVERERKQKKEYLIKSTSGMYIIFYIFLILIYILAVGVGFMGDEKKNNIFSLCLNLFNMFNLMIIYLEMPLFQIKENGKMVNVLKKYQYMPVSLKTVFLAKMAVFCSDIIKHAFLATGLSMMISLCVYRKFSYLGQTLIPLYIGMILIVIYGVGQGMEYVKLINGKEKIH